ncbi:MAG: serine hydrolase domain-containing protein [Candidatus Hodarchaeales archaeon]|jgi:CubicO group peptidase (beta-lactamase class C family)
MVTSLTEITSPRFNALSKELQGIIDEEKTGGISCLVYHKGEVVYRKTFGWLDRLNQERMGVDTIHRIYSMTKPILCAALLILYEEGKFDLDDPISKFMPEFKRMEILTSYDKDTDTIETINTSKQITIKDLFMHTSGISYGSWPKVLIDYYYARKFEVDTSIPVYPMLEKQRNLESLENFCKTLSKLPLAFNPGDHYWYGFSHDILGFLIEKLSGKSLDEYLKERIFTKLEMRDTGLSVNENNKNRLSKVYTKNKENVLLELEGPVLDGFYEKPRLLSGGGGLVSTLEDYLHFCQMLLNHGKYNGLRILKESTVKLMTTNHFPNNVSVQEMRFIKITDPEWLWWDIEHGMGLGVAVKIKDNITKKSIGSHSWEGVLNTHYWIDPKKEVIFILLTQYWFYDLLPPLNLNQIEDLVYTALDPSLLI